MRDADSTLVLDEPDPRRRGEIHGEVWRRPIHELAAIRTDLLLSQGAFRGSQDIIDAAQASVPVLAITFPGLHAELEGIARGAGLSLPALVILNGYTDLRDMGAAVTREAGGCTAVCVPGTEGPIVGQTWDMHGSAEPYVRLLQIRPRGTDREVLCLTLAGCLGMTGMNERGVAVTINNLSCMDAAKGVIWPAVVRAMLEQPSAARALVLLLEAPLMGGRHYMVADRRDVFGVEASASLKAVVHGGPGGGPYVHTNHCLDARMRAHERLLPETTTHRRRTLVMELIGAPKPFAADHLWKVLGSHEGYPRSICSHLDDESGDPSHSRTCAIIVMDPASGRVLFRRGCGQAGPPSELRVERRADAS